ncbi:MAG: pilus assembly protein PilP [Acidobacteriia bacterium]|nr:pilus assembly protein PilP [Terriglobia bacterium]
MKLTTGILIVGMALGTAWGQNPDVIENTRNTLKAVERKKEIDSNAALAASQGKMASPAPATSSAASQPKVSSAAPAHVASKAKASAPATAKKSPVAHITAAKAPAKPAKTKTKTAAAKPAATRQVAVEDKKMPADPKKDEPKPINLTGRRDPFVSPVVNRSMLGSGCSTGKKCLAIDQIALKGVVKMDTGMIAVVVNAMNKAYFLKENDPVFNGYVVKITGDSIIFKETLQDKLGKSFTREVTKKITTPAV